MDGNGRWAAARGLPVAEGHREGARALRRTVEAAIDLGIDSLAVYAFSTENWARPPDEVESIFELLDETIERELPDLAKQGVRTRFFGRRDRVPADLQAKMAQLEAETAHLERLQLWIAFDYGGRAELVEAMRSILREGVRHQDLSEADMAGASLRARAPRSRPRDPHVRRAADLELPALAVGVRGARLRRHAVAGLRRGAAPSPRVEEYASRAPTVRREMSPLLSRVLVAAILLPLVIGLVYLGGWWLFGARARRRLARAPRALRHGSRPPAARPGRLPRVRAARCSDCSSAGSSGCSAGCSRRSSSRSSSTGSAASGSPRRRRSASRSSASPGSGPGSGASCSFATSRTSGSGRSWLCSSPSSRRTRERSSSGRTLGRHRLAPAISPDEVVGGLRRRRARGGRDGIRDPLQGPRRLPLDPAVAAARPRRSRSRRCSAISSSRRSSAISR